MRFVDLLHARRRIARLVQVRVVLARQAAKGLLDVVAAGIARHTQRLVIVLEVHGRGGPR
jgi:hypothetical protein